MPAAIKKIEVRCPHCEGIQLEPRGAVSTFCHHCGQHFDIHPPTRQIEKPGFTLLRRVRSGRQIHCYKCGTKHEVSHHAKTTFCPSCGTSMEIGNLVVSSNTSRPVDLRGRLTVRKGANLNNSWIICTEAEIYGRITGTLLCEERLLLHGSGRLSFQAHAEDTRIDKGADIELGYPLLTRSLDLRGRLAGSVVCSGRVHIRKGAALRGSLDATSVTVDRGGILSGHISVRPNAGQTGGGVDLQGVFRPGRLAFAG